MWHTMLPALLPAAQFAQITWHKSHAQLHANALATAGTHAQTRPSRRAQSRRHCVHAAHHASKTAKHAAMAAPPPLPLRARPPIFCAFAHTCTYGVFKHRRCPARDKGIARARRHSPPPPNSLCGRRRRASHIASLTHCVGGFAHVTRTQPRRRGGEEKRALPLG